MAARFGSRGFHNNITKHARKRIQRTFCSKTGNSESIVNVPLSQPLPNFNLPKYSLADKQTYETNVTVLDNGLTVASQNYHFSQFCTVGVAIDSGSRYEVSYPSGVTHFLQKLAFGATTKYDSSDAIAEKLDKHGGIFDCISTKDVTFYAISAEKRGLSEAVDILGETVLRPKMTEKEIEDVRQAINYETDDINNDPNPSILLDEMIYKAAYRDNTLGLPKYGQIESSHKIDRGILYTYLNSVHLPFRTVIAGAGVDHSQLVELTKKFMIEEKQPIWQENSELIDKSKKLDGSISQYTGGIVKQEKDLSNVSLSSSAMPELAHVVLGFESCSHNDPDYIAFCVLFMLLGRGSSFSAGGPGKGLYTRLYRNVIQRYPWIETATADCIAYNDSGLFYIRGSSHPTMLNKLVDVIIKELLNTTGKIYEEELKRAKRQLQSMMMMNLESRPLVFEDIARQVLANGSHKPAQFYYDAIDQITAEDINRVASRMLRSKPAVAAYGTLDKLPLYDDIEAKLASSYTSRLKFSSPFSRLKL
ncbi:hypothetical protein LOTGIDRAFT_222316 [Lottia gigantea]|uniref:Uncharacterized protein n=1 Tax=Lottia gigantea TaxID=225164 RepID=V3Z0B6_LOTGI|nr:hypothetical protein LOTGIDRAFT_222316 [Lottia gigantea]ESO83893.1 hypothetical protein LOTGIDRAFT_222316 [Lottia gigantea]